ncbi:high-affinity potassium transporter [Emericellopsis atlantica]|uniref:High-affinity potassium transporter n=1 Tax=Emericellopsis atlantica TaxID=2614577 RepID=A0A9P7ZWM0_9HYPO|nr:high-affinity potassium transporter [Emericellopsis atlantica]KAG9258890.1 high-affinity potassium transporter [Emericellopsis atlantica]
MEWSRLKPPINFVTIHYVYIIFMGLLSLAILYPAGNLKAIDAYFFGASASTESGLNTVDVKELYLYQQLYLYFIPMFTNLGFINAFTVLVRLFWFRKHLKKVAPKLLTRERRRESPESEEDVEDAEQPKTLDEPDTADTTVPAEAPSNIGRRITIDPSANLPREDSTLYIPGPRDREHGSPLMEVDRKSYDDAIKPVDTVASSSNADLRRRNTKTSGTLAQSTGNIASVARSMLILDTERTQRRNSRASSMTRPPVKAVELDKTLSLSRHATIGRNGEFQNLTKQDRERLSGIEYQSLKLLLKIVFAYFFGLHIFGAICLVVWIQYASPKYTDVLQQAGQDKNWWAFYSSQTMIDNLGFTLTPDSMISFRDAPWPMIIMSFLAFAGNTLYPVFLRLVIWTLSKVAPKGSSIQQPLHFLLKYPRRCYTLLFPSGPTWILFGIIFALNFIDTLLIIVLDLDNPEVNALPIGKRILAAIFQAASSRHTGTSSFNLASVSPAVQFSLMVMMYIAIFPIALSIRASNTYEEKSLGIYPNENPLNEANGRSYVMTHLQNQLNFDLWYIFLGIFCLCIAESKRIANPDEPAFTVWTIFFEVTSAYGNVGLSLGYPTVMTSLSGMFGVFGKLVICAMMIRGRHRGLPYSLDHAIMLPDEDLLRIQNERDDEP